MLPLVLPQLFWALSGAPSLAPYDFDPTDIPSPSWSDSLENSVRPGQPVGFRAVVHDAGNRLIGRDTFDLFFEAGSLRKRSTQWSFGIDSTRSVREYWSQGNQDRYDSMIWRSCRKDSCQTNLRLWTRSTPLGRLTVTGHSERSDKTFAQLDSSLRRTDSLGRFTYQRSWYDPSNKVFTIDSVEWGIEKPRLWINQRKSHDITTLERHHPTWEGTRLVRDSVVRRTTRESGSFTDSTILRVYSWDGPRVQTCITLPDSTITSLVSWSAEGRPLFRGETIDEWSVKLSSWLWDERGRLVQTREWGTETDLDSLVYGDGALPERSLLYSCTGEVPGLPDSCTLRKARTFLYDASPLAIGAPAPNTRHLVHGLSGDRVRFQDLGPTARRVVLMTLDGRILATATPVSGECTLHRPETPGIAFYGILDAQGRRIATGRLPGF